MQEAYNLEIQRNDSMRLRFAKTKKGVKQYFLPEIKTSKIEFKDFSDSTEEEMMSWLNQRAGKTFKYYKDETYEMIFFKTPDGQSGLYFCTVHLAMDIYGIILLLKDMMDVYASLKNGTEMPDPLTLFENSLQRDIEYRASERAQKDIAYFEEYWKDQPLITYCGIDGGRELNQIRKKKKNPNHRAVNALELLKNKSKTTIFHVDQETTDHWMNFVNEYHFSFQALMHLSMFLSISAINNREEALSMMFIKNRRVKKDDLRCGGDMANGHAMACVFPKDTTVKDALEQIGKDLLKHMKHSGVSSLNGGEIVQKYQQLRIGEVLDSLSYSVLPPGSLSSPKGFDCEFLLLSGMRFFYSAYQFIYPSLRGGMNFVYKMFTSKFTDADIRNYFDLTIKSIEAIIANPEGTIGDMYTAIL